MGKYKVMLYREAVNDISEHIKSGNKSLVLKINTILEELSEHPESGTGKPERLKYQYHDYWSRRLNREHRIIYKIDEHEVSVVIVSAKGHYNY